MKPNRYIVWSKEDIDLKDTFQKKWYYRQVLINGRAEDIAAIVFPACPPIFSSMPFIIDFLSAAHGIMRQAGKN